MLLSNSSSSMAYPVTQVVRESTPLMLREAFRVLESGAKGSLHHLQCVVKATLASNPQAVATTLSEATSTTTTVHSSLPKELDAMMLTLSCCVVAKQSANQARVPLSGTFLGR